MNLEELEEYLPQLQDWAEKGIAEHTVVSEGDPHFRKVGASIQKVRDLIESAREEEE